MVKGDLKMGQAIRPLVQFSSVLKMKAAHTVSDWNAQSYRQHAKNIENTSSSNKTERNHSRNEAAGCVHCE